MSYRSKVAVVYLLGFFLDLINMFIASVAFPAMAQAFNATPSSLAWVSNGYIAGLTLVIPFSTLLTRRLGPKHVILLSLFLFSAASVAAGLSSSLESLIAWRVLQGMGGGLLIPVGQALTWQQLNPMSVPGSPQRSCWLHCLRLHAHPPWGECWFRHSAGDGYSLPQRLSPP